MLTQGSYITIRAGIVVFGFSALFLFDYLLLIITIGSRIKHMYNITAAQAINVKASIKSSYGVSLFLADFLGLSFFFMIKSPLK